MNVNDAEFLDIVRVVLYEFKIDKVEGITEVIRRRIWERRQKQNEFWNDVDPEEVARFVRKLRDMDKVGGTD